MNENNNKAIGIINVSSPSFDINSDNVPTRAKPKLNNNTVVTLYL